MYMYKWISPVNYKHAHFDVKNIKIEWNERTNQ